MQNFSKKCMPAIAAGVQNSGKITHPFATTTGTSFGNLIYTTFFCNDTPLTQTIKFQVLKKKFRRYKAVLQKLHLQHR